jgi:hypothetical protein
MPSVAGAAAADTDSDFSDSDDALASDDERDERDREPVFHDAVQPAAPGLTMAMWPEPEPEPAAAAETLLRQKERQLALLQREVAEIKQQLPQLLADERAPSFDASATPTDPSAPAATVASLQAGRMRCVLCQKILADKPTLVNIMRVPSPTPTGPTQCQKCSAVCCAVYCSIAHQREDDKRHAAECQAVMGDAETRRCVERAKRVRPPPRVGRYHCGMSDDHPFEVRRTIAPTAGSAAAGESTAAAVATADAAEDPLVKYIARVDRSAVLGPGLDKAWAVLRGQEKLPTDTAAVAAAEAKAPPPAVAAPWVSFGSSSSVVLNWLPPGLRFDPRVAPQSYEIQQREACLGGDRDGGVGPWEKLKEPHEGSVPAHTVRHLNSGAWYQFRVLPAGFPQEDDCVWSEPSVPVRVGYADYSDVSSSFVSQSPSSYLFCYYLRNGTKASFLPIQTHMQ